MPADEFDERLAGRCFQLLKAQRSRVSGPPGTDRGALERTIEAEEAEPWTPRARGTKVNAGVY